MDKLRKKRQLFPVAFGLKIHVVLTPAVMSCIFHSDCLTNRYCDPIDFKCKKTENEGDPCQSATVCPLNTYCHSVHKRCRKICTASDINCKYDSGSEKHLELKSNCDSDKDCAVGKFCPNRQTCWKMEEKEGNICDFKKRCQVGLECLEGICVKLCNKKHTCPSGYICEYGVKKTVGICKKFREKSYSPTPTENGSSIGIILGIVIPLIVVIVITIVVVVVVYKKKKRRRANAASMQPMPQMDEVTPPMYTPNVHSQYPNITQSYYQQHQSQPPIHYIENDPSAPPPAYF